MAMGEFNPKHAAYEILWLLFVLALVPLHEVSKTATIILAISLSIIAPLCP